jgi:hypothetical protein
MVTAFDLYQKVIYHFAFARSGFLVMIVNLAIVEIDDDKFLLSKCFQDFKMLDRAVNRNLALTTEKNDLLNFLGSYFLSISWREVSPVLYQIP